MNDIADLARSNSLADLAARIRAEHEASELALQRGFEHAINAGHLLIEAKAQLGHGQWLPWLAEHCQVSRRTCQAYMKVARAFDALPDDAKAQRVADLSFRDALHSLALDQALRRVKIIARPRFTLETPPAMLPSANGRKIRVARHPEKRQWMLAIGPNISRATLMQKEQAARATPVVRDLQQQHDELIEQAAALEAEAKALREDAAAIAKQIGVEIKREVGAALPFTETFDFQADEQTDAELAGLPQQEAVNRLLSARGTVGEGLRELKRGWWGDAQFMGYQRMTAGPGKSWDAFGSPEWLEQLFPNWNEPPVPTQ